MNMSNNTEFLKSCISKFLTWFTRTKNIAVTVGTLFFITGFGGLAISSFLFENKSNDGTTTKIQITANETPQFINCLLWSIGIIGFFILSYVVIDYFRQKQKSVVIGVEHIGLRKRIATPLSAFLEKAETIPIDLTDCYENDKLLKPKEALGLTKFAIKETLKSKSAEIGNKEIKVIYGGMPPVGLGFFAGYLMANTYHVEIWDYNRNAKDGKNWYKVDGYADTNRPIIIEDNYIKDKDVCILMSISYPVAIEQVRAKVSYPSYIDIKMPQVKFDSMSSIEKITDFEKKFGELLKKLAADGTERVHIFCAAQASFNFCMGRQITRNHPAIIVYEYEISNSEKYPWGVLFNTKDDTSPAII
jgi:hypothetical protein